MNVYQQGRLNGKGLLMVSQNTQPPHIIISLLAILKFNRILTIDFAPNLLQQIMKVM